MRMMKITLIVTLLVLCVPNMVGAGSKQVLQDAKEYDGLIITAPGIRPSLVQTIYAIGGRTVYECDMVDSEQLIAKGCAGYAPTIEKARALLSKFGVDNPLELEGIVPVEPKRAVILSNSDADLVESLGKHTSALKEANVVFVLSKDK